MGRIAALDYGTVRIGLAMSDERKIIAQPIACLQTKKTHKQTAEMIKLELAKFSTIECVLLGLPLHFSGKESPMSLEVRKFAQILECTLNLPIVLCDERLTTAFTERALIEGNVRREKRKSLIDALSATVVLQTYLDKRSNTP